jgi:putative membrane protein
VLRTTVLSIGCAVLLFAGGCSRDYDQGTMTDQERSAAASIKGVDDSQQFVQKAAIDNMAEIQLGQLASKRAESPDVKRFAQQMVDDHTRALDELTTAASRGGVQVARDLDEKHRDIHQRLSTLQGKEFDREYIKSMVEAHESAVEMLDGRSGILNRGTDAAPISGTSKLDNEVNQWAAKTLPTVRTHLEKAKELRDQL